MRARRRCCAPRSTPSPDGHRLGLAGGSIAFPRPAHATETLARRRAASVPAVRTGAGGGGLVRLAALAAGAGTHRVPGFAAAAGAGCPHRCPARNPAGAGAATAAGGGNQPGAARRTARHRPARGAAGRQRVEAGRPRPPRRAIAAAGRDRTAARHRPATPAAGRRRGWCAPRAGAGGAAGGRHRRPGLPQPAPDPGPGTGGDGGVGRGSAGARTGVAGRADGRPARCACGDRIVAELRALPLRADSPLSGTTLQQLRALRGQ